MTLRSLTQHDAEITMKWRKSERASKLGGAPSNISAQAAWINSRPNTEHNFIIELHSGLSVGMISLIDVDLKNGTAQTARFLIGEEDACKGIPIAVESMLLIYEYAFNQLNLHRIYGFISSANTQMIKWQVYLGMKHEGTWRSHLKLEDGSYMNAELYGLLEIEYREETRKKLSSLMRISSQEK